MKPVWRVFKLISEWQKKNQPCLTDCPVSLKVFGIDVRGQCLVQEFQNLFHWVTQQCKFWQSQENSFNLAGTYK